MYELIIILVLVVLGYLFGRIAEQRHYKSIDERENNTMTFLMVSMKTVPADYRVHECMLVSGSVVISLDYFKRIFAALKTIFGGRITSYETLIDRARREAILRMKEQAMAHNATMVYNVRLETSSISKNERQSVGSVEVIAYGTALRMEA